MKKTNKNVDDRVADIVRIAETRKRLEEQKKNLYPEIKLPMDFVSKFEKKKNLSIGSLNYSKREY